MIKNKIINKVKEIILKFANPTRIYIYGSQVNGEANEMAWKALKRYLEFLGFEPKSPRVTFKEGYSQDILKDENIWLEMIEQRNLSSHIYDEYEISEIVDKTDDYRKAFLSLKIEIEAGLSK